MQGKLGEHFSHLFFFYLAIFSVHKYFTERSDFLVMPNVVNQPFKTLLMFNVCFAKELSDNKLKKTPPPYIDWQYGLWYIRIQNIAFVAQWFYMKKPSWTTRIPSEQFGIVHWKTNTLSRTDSES